jgi:WD40 repeat protein
LLADPLSFVQDGDAEDALVAVAFSNNGYHLGTAHASATVRFWDLRKQKTLAVMNTSKELLDSVTTLAYDDSGKYVAMGGSGGVRITTVKEWGTTASIATGKKPVSGIVWTQSTIAICSDKERTVRILGTEN